MKDTNVKIRERWMAFIMMVSVAILSKLPIVSAFSSTSRHPFRVVPPQRALVLPPSPSSSSSYLFSSCDKQLIPPLLSQRHISNPITSLFMSEEKFEKITDDDDQVIAFLDEAAQTSIDCYVDSYATVDGIEYTIGSPCDYAVALCYFEGDDQLVPIELDDSLMDDIFPIAEGIIEDEFGEELVLLRTPQTLTLVGELDETEDEEDREYDEEDDMDDAEEEVEILVSFEEGDQEYHLVRLLDPVLLVGKAGNENKRILLTPEESDLVMPKLEEMFLNFQEDRDEL